MITSSTASPVYRLRAGTVTDSYGDPVESWAPADVSRERLRGAAVQAPSSTEESSPAASQLTNERRLFAPSRLDLTDADRVEVDGVVWRVEGVPVVRRGLASGVYTTATLSRFTSR